MIYLKTAWMMLKKNPITNFLTVLQMTVVLCVCAVMVSAVTIRYQYYAPFRDYFASNGVFACYNTYASSDPDVLSVETLMETEDILGALDGATDMISCYGAALFDLDNLNQDFRVISYDKEILERYTPQLQAGRWLETNGDQTRVEAVVSENAYGWKVGDVLTLGDTPDSDGFSVEIVGMLENSARIVGNFSLGDVGLDFNSFYNYYSFDVEEIPVLLFSHEGLKAAGVPQAVRYGSLIRFSDAASQAEIDAAIAQLGNYGDGAFAPMSQIQESSIAYLFEQIERLLPIVVIVFLLVVVSSVSGSALSTRKHLHHYVIYTISGLPWNRCVCINLIQTMFLLAISTGLTALSLMALQRFTDTVEILLSGWLVGVFGVIDVMYVLVSMAMPAAMIWRHTPKEVLNR